MQSKFGFNGEVLRKAKITYIISGGDTQNIINLGYEIIKDHNEELALKKNGIVYAIGESGLSIGSIHISRRIEGVQQQDIGSDKESKDTRKVLEEPKKVLNEI